MWQKRRGYHGEESREALYLSQPVSSDILSPEKTEAAAAAGAVSSACATFRRAFETYLMSSTQPLAWPGQSPSVKAASAFAPGLPWSRWAVTVQVVMVVAVTPAVGVWEDERVRTSISGGDWLPAIVDGGALLRLKPIHEKTTTTKKNKNKNKTTTTKKKNRK